MPGPTRRTFIKGCAMTAAAAGLSSRLLEAAQDQPDVLVVLFLRGGMDGLSLLPPVSGADRSRYETARPTLRVPLSGGNSAIPLADGLGLHPAAAPLAPWWHASRMAVVPAAGMHHPTRSHFEAEDFIELGTPGSTTTGTGWLHRHLVTAPNLPAEIPVPALAAGLMQPTSLLGSGEALTVDDPEYFTYLWGPWGWRDAQQAAMRTLYAEGIDAVRAAGRQAMDGVDLVEAYVSETYQPSGGAVYPGDDLGRHLSLVAQLMAADLGIRVVAVDYGGWDTHESQGPDGGGLFADLASSLALGLEAFLTDLEASGLGERLTVMVMTEFGRRLDENADGGTDHGHAAPMLLFGPNVVGGFHGSWPGLAREALFEGLDLEVTTDFRRVLSEVLIRRLGNPALGAVFPGYTEYEPLGVVSGVDLPPDYGTPAPRRTTGRV